VPRRRKRERAAPRRRWRDYRTAAGRRPVKEFVDRLTDADAAEVAAAMHEVVTHGISAAKHLRGDIYEVKADGDRRTFRILFAQEGKHDQVLLALEGFSKKQQKTPLATIELAARRLRDWRSRSRTGRA
jgi:phage-related protein